MRWRRLTSRRSGQTRRVRNTGDVGVGDIPLNGGVDNKFNWAPRLGATYQVTEKTVLRGGYGRVYDIGVFGSLFSGGGGGHGFQNGATEPTEENEKKIGFSVFSAGSVAPFEDP